MLLGHRKGATLSVAALVFVVLAVAACGGSNKKRVAANVGWTQWGNNMQHTFYSSLSLINRSNVNKLGIAWSAPEGSNLTTWETDPVVVGDTMYYTTSSNQVYAVNATNGAVKWVYTPQVNFYLAVAGGGGGVPTNRGVSVVNGKVYELTFDDKLIALSQATGERLWQSQVANPYSGYSETTVPIYYNGLLYVGSAESDAGLRGFVAAYNANTGQQVWRYYTVPAPGQGWMPATGAHGGGDVWMPVTVDPTNNTVYVGTGNPSPDLVNRGRPGCNPWVDATLALNAMTGALKWAHTEVCPDVWDYDSMPSPAVFDVQKGGQTIHAVGHANKLGYYWIFNANTGQVLSKTLAEPNQSNPRPHPTPAGVKVCPGALGGIEYTPAAYDPQTHMVYQQTNDECMIESTQPYNITQIHTQGQVDIGGQIAPVISPTAKPDPVTGLIPSVGSGVMTAIDANTGAVAWQQRESKFMIGGSLATAGGLVFAGSDNGNLYAYDAKTGKTLASFNLGLPYGAGPITYEVNGTQYVAIAAGGSNSPSFEGLPSGDRLVVLKLGGSTVKPFTPVSQASTPTSQLPVLSAYKKVNPYIYVSSARKTIVIEMIAGATSAQSGFNYDGYYNGQADFVVPVGWNVTLDFQNKSSTPHSILLTNSLKTPLIPTPPPGGLAVITPAATKGLRGVGLHQVAGFTTRVPGKFYIACAVPGHVEAGMFDYLTVSATAKQPAIVVGKGTSYANASGQTLK
jgi:alcohol dehydrogenase (cytochrome c)